MKIDMNDVAGELLDWWKAEPWRIKPIWSDGWDYVELYRNYRNGYDLGREMYMQPYSMLASAWFALTFPHLHDEELFIDDLSEPVETLEVQVEVPEVAQQVKEPEAGLDLDHALAARLQALREDETNEEQPVDPRPDLPG